ncbi:MAG: hypothetical protein ACYCXN_05655, partial [Acidimicrobiales bacterium]
MRDAAVPSADAGGQQAARSHRTPHRRRQFRRRRRLQAPLGNWPRSPRWRGALPASLLDQLAAREPTIAFTHSSQGLSGRPAVTEPPATTLSRNKPVCNMPPTLPSATGPAGERPKRVTFTAPGWPRPTIMSIVVYLPVPFGPSRATVSPGEMSRDHLQPRRAGYQNASPRG